jgi:dihydrofolate reductase
MERYAEHSDEDVYVIGGGTVYQALLPYADRIELTRIDATIEGDVYFPEFEDQFTLVHTQSHTDDDYSFSFLTYEKI